MALRDIIEVALNSPMDWERFESLVAEILQRDDFPRLRKIGGRGDRGVDAVEEVFFGDESRTQTVIQVTSQRAQVDKFRSTVARLREEHIEFTLLVLVFRQPVASATRTHIQHEAHGLGLSVDIRDQWYLISQLAKPGSNIYSRYFESISRQVKALLRAPDSLQVASDPLRHAMLASLGAFVLNPHARIARRTLFEKTVLAAIVSLGEADIDAILDSLRLLMPGEQIDETRVRSSIDSLRASREITVEGRKIIPKEETLVSVGRALTASKSAFDGIRNHVLESCSQKSRLDDASIGYLERNLRRAIVALFRNYGPITPETPEYYLNEQSSHGLLECLGCDLAPEIARVALISLGSYLEDKENAIHLGVLARTYAALAIRNLDPLGRRWQQAALARSVLALDTDAVLYIIIAELPEHPILLRALLSLQQSEFRIVVSEAVINEVAGNIGRAHRTYTKFRESLTRMSPSMVDSQVWHAIVRGYYYASQNNHNLSWWEYWHGYYDAEDPERYIRFLLGRVLKAEIVSLENIPENWFSDLETIATNVLTYKERARPKADFRDEEYMRKRAYDDIRMAMHLATYESQTSVANAKGYIISQDTAFLWAQRHKQWPPRPEVLIFTWAVPQLATFLCGEVYDEDQVTRLFFDPVISAAASLMESEIKTLTSLGIDLRSVSLGRLEWDLSSGLYDAVHEFSAADPKQAGQRIPSAIHVLDVAKEHGLPIDPAIQDLANSYKTIESESAKERVAYQKMQDAVHRLALAAGKTKKARRRVNRVLEEIGLKLGDLGIDDQEDE